MAQTCSVNCSERPDAVEKINWKCVECGRDLKADFEKVTAQRELDATKLAKEQAEKEAPTLSDEEIEKRRAMYK